MVQDFANGNYNIPLQFVGNISLDTPGVYYYRVHAEIKGKQYWSDENTLEVKTQDYKVTVMDAPKEVAANAVFTFTWRVDGVPTTINHTSIHYGTVSQPGPLGKEVAPADTKYIDLVKDFAKGNYNIPLQFVGNTTITKAAMFFSILIRQTNIIWLFFVFIFSYLNLYGFEFKSQNIRKYLSGAYYYLIPAVVFIIFVVLNGGVALQDQIATPSFEIHTGNIFMTLFLFFLLFFPLHIAHFGKVAAILKGNLAILIPAVLFLILSIVLFPLQDPMNTDPKHLTNIFLSVVHSSLLLKILFAAIAVFTVISLGTVQFIKKSYYLVYFFMILSLIPFWLVVPRYGIMSLLLFNTFRKSESPATEKSIAVLFLVLSLFLLGIFLSREYLL